LFPALEEINEAFGELPKLRYEIQVFDQSRPANGVGFDLKIS
jgi:hypothetical protein